MHQILESSYISFIKYSALVAEMKGEMYGKMEKLLWNLWSFIVIPSVKQNIGSL